MNEKEIQTLKDTVEYQQGIINSLNVRINELQAMIPSLKHDAKICRDLAEKYQNKNTVLLNKIEKYEALCPSMNEAQKIRYLTDMENYDKFMESGSYSHRIIEPQWSKPVNSPKFDI